MTTVRGPSSGSVAHPVSDHATQAAAARRSVRVHATGERATGMAWWRCMALGRVQRHSGPHWQPGQQLVEREGVASHTHPGRVVDRVRHRRARAAGAELADAFRLDRARGGRRRSWQVDRIEVAGMSACTGTRYSAMSWLTKLAVVPIDQPPLRSAPRPRRIPCRRWPGFRAVFSLRMRPAANTPSMRRTRVSPVSMSTPTSQKCAPNAACA